jgi:uncharacterized membrane protein (UPF0127 family)
MNWSAIPVLLGLLALAGCSQQAAPPAPAVAPVAAAAPAPGSSYPTKAQPRLQTTKLFIGPKEITAELAITGLQVQTGMMFRTNMPANEGMLFVFDTPHRASFWMKNTVYPLTAAYIDPEGVILEIHDLQPLNEVSVTASNLNIQYVLEVNRDWFKSNGIPVGTRIATEKGSLRDTFFPAGRK